MRPDLWAPEPGFLNTASYGLPPRPAVDAMQGMLDEWQAGRTSWEPWDRSVDRARDSFARLVGVPVHPDADHDLARARVPESQDFVLAAGRQRLAVGGEGQEEGPAGTPGQFAARRGRVALPYVP